MEWTTAYINELPDECFAYIEPGGKKDEEGKTVPRSLRHLPYKDKNGKIDLPHLRNALARLPQTDIPLEGKREALKNLIAAAKEVGIEVDEERYQKEYRLAEGRLKIPFFRLGKWRHPRYGLVEGTQQMFDQIKANFKRRVLGRDPFVRIGHERDDATVYAAGEAKGWVKDIVQEGDVLYAIAEPTDEQIAEAIKNKRYRYASAEIEPNYLDKETGLRVGAVLSAVALTNEPFLTRLPDAMALADKIHLDYEEVDEVKPEELLKENNNLLKSLIAKLSDFFGKKTEQGADQPEEIKKLLAEVQQLKTQVGESQKKQSKLEVDNFTKDIEMKLAGLVAQGVPPVLCEKAKAIILADPQKSMGTVKLADNKEASFAEMILDLLGALPAENRVKMAQLGSQAKPAAGSEEELRKLAEEDVKALGGKVTADGKYVF
ncbi:MAG: phage protease [Bacillota bacterium]